MDGPPNKKHQRPRVSGQTTEGLRIRRSKILDGTLKVFFGPGQFWEGESDPYVAPTNWPATGTLLRVPKVARFFYCLKEWSDETPPDTNPEHQPPTDPSPPGSDYPTLSSALKYRLVTTCSDPASQNNWIQSWSMIYEGGNFGGTWADSGNFPLPSSSSDVDYPTRIFTESVVQWKLTYSGAGGSVVHWVPSTYSTVSHLMPDPSRQGCYILNS